MRLLQVEELNTIAGGCDVCGEEKAMQEMVRYGACAVGMLVDNCVGFGHLFSLGAMFCVDYAYGAFDSE